MCRNTQHWQLMCRCAVEVHMEHEPPTSVQLVRLNLHSGWWVCLCGRSYPKFEYKNWVQSIASQGRWKSTLPCTSSLWTVNRFHGGFDTLHWSKHLPFLWASLIGLELESFPSLCRHHAQSSSRGQSCRYRGKHIVKYAVLMNSSHTQTRPLRHTWPFDVTRSIQGHTLFQLCRKYGLVVNTGRGHQNSIELKVMLQSLETRTLRTSEAKYPIANWVPDSCHQNIPHEHSFAKIYGPLILISASHTMLWPSMIMTSSLGCTSTLYRLYTSC